MTFRNDALQKERAAILKNDVRANTLQGRTIAELQMESGRFAKPSVVTAGEGPPTYPAAAPWTQDRLGQEPPLGVDINKMEALGEPHEIEIERCRALAASSHSDERDYVAGADVPSSQPQSMLSVAPANSQSKLWTRPL